MSNGANSFHILLRHELEDYIKSQYFGKSPLLLSAIKDKLSDEGLLYQKPYIESSPAYKSIPNGIQKSADTDISPWMKDFFGKLSKAKLGVYPEPFEHQIKALEAALNGRDLFVATGTGSGKTECFMWPLIAKMAREAKEKPDSWSGRGVRAIIMYPMNALVSDQVSRLRRLIGDPEDKFLDIFKTTCGENSRRPQFGMYTGRTSYPGAEPDKTQDRKLENKLREMCFPKNENKEDENDGNNFYKNLLKSGKIPAKKNMAEFLERLHEGRHIPNDDDAELITRFEMQQFCPDILITNYSMLEYMLLRPREKRIWDDTKSWLDKDPDNKLLFIIDEAHMYRGSSGGEVALLIRRLFHKLNIPRDRVQFILTTASMPNSTEADRKKVLEFAKNLTACDGISDFCYLTGTREEIKGKQKYDLPFKKFLNCSPSDFENNEEIKLNSLNKFWSNVPGSFAPFDTLKAAEEWMYDNLIYYRPFYELIRQCRGKAVSLSDLAKSIFPNQNETDSLWGVSVLLAIAPLAKNNKDIVLFPARMHMLFRGINGAYACANENCTHNHSDENLTLGEIFLSDRNLVCPHCGSAVYELYQDRRCGALYFKGYILENDLETLNQSYLWRYPGQILDQQMKEIHLFIPQNMDEIKKTKRKYQIKPCYMDVKSGFINFKDDSWEDREGIRKLYYCKYSQKGKPTVVTFPDCPHCTHKFSKSSLTSFSTRGNQSFFNLIKTQFYAQPAVTGKDDDPKRFPNEGRKVLLFSDSRQRAAKLARDMSESSELHAARQLFSLVLDEMEKFPKECTMNTLYDYFCLAAARKNIQIFPWRGKRKVYRRLLLSRRTI